MLEDKDGNKEGAELKNPAPSAESAVEQPEKVQPETVTPTDDASALVAEAEQRQVELQAEIDRKEAVIQRLKEKVELRKRKEKATPLATTTPNTQLETMKLMVSDLEARDAEQGTVNPRVAQIKQMITEEEQRQVYEKQVQNWQQTTESEREKIEAQIEEAGLNPTDSQFDAVWDKFDIASYQTGNFDAVNQRLGRVLKTVKPVNKEKKEETPEITPELREKIEREYVIKNGIISSDESGPSGTGTRSFTREEIRKITEDGKYEENREVIEAAYKGGRIK